MKKKRERTAQIVRWVCPNCGQTYFSEDAPPDMCDFCSDFTTWQRLSLEPKPNSRDDEDDLPIQLPLF